jgi:hypothetical protein
MTINRSKGLLHTSESIHTRCVSAAPIKTYLTSKVKDIEAGSPREDRIPAKISRA